MEKQVALNPGRSIKGGIYARYNLSRDGDQTLTIEAQLVMYREKAGSRSPIRVHSQPLPKFPTINTFRD